MSALAGRLMTSEMFAGGLLCATLLPARRRSAVHSLKHQITNKITKMLSLGLAVTRNTFW